MNIYWHLVWLVPVALFVGIIFGGLLPRGRGPEGPPYAEFHVEPKTTDEMDEQATMYQWSGKTMADLPGVYYKSGDPPDTYVIQPGIAIHRQVEAYQRYLLESVPQPHIGPCNPQCWRSPDGHRRETS